MQNDFWIEYNKNNNDTYNNKKFLMAKILNQYELLKRNFIQKYFNMFL